MRAKTLKDLLTLFNPQQHLDHTQHHFFVNIFGRELNRFANEIASASSNQTFFITGQSGNGKTSMLRNLQAHYPKLLGEGFYFLYLEGRDLFDLESLDIQDVMYAIAQKLMPKEPLTKESMDMVRLNEIVGRYEKEVLGGKKRLVLVIDDFEKIVIADANKTDDAMYRFLFRDIPSLRYLDAIKLITFPFHFKNSTMIEDGLFRDFIVHLDDFGRVDVNSIKEVILKRLEERDLVQDIEFLIGPSGANMRQLIQIIYQAGINSDTFGGTKIDRDDIKEAIVGLRKDFSAFVNSHLAFYRYIRQNHNIDPNNAEHQELLHLTLRNRTVFAYLFEGSYYYGVNPVVLELLDGRGKPEFFNEK
jgi:hypothetical protein